MAASLGIGVVQLNFGLNMGDYLAWLPRWTFETFSYSQDPATTADWMANWTLFFWAWWVAWAPFVGLLFFVTSADAGALVMAKFSSISQDPQQDGAPWMRLMWSVASPRCRWPR